MTAFDRIGARQHPVESNEPPEPPRPFQTRTSYGRSKLAHARDTIRARVAAGDAINTLAKEYGVQWNTIKRLCREERS